MSSFDDAERRSKLALGLPKSSNHGKVVKLAPKVLKTEKEIRTVLPEEQYLQKLEKIIVKDYFPELPKLKAQSEYMDAVSRNDVAKMRELQLRFNTQRRTDRRTSPSLRRGTSPGRSATSPAHFDPDTPGPSRGIDGTPLPYANMEGDNERLATKEKKSKNEMENLSIDGYLNKFTSEDNASFEELTELAARRARAKNAWVYEAADSHNKEKVVRSAIAASADLQLALKYDAQADAEKPRELDNWNYKTLNTVLFYPEGAKMSAEELALNAKRSQREINRSGTRFPDDMKNRASESSMARAAMLQAANNAGKVDVTGMEAGVPTKMLGLLVTPSPAPGVEDSPFMTWGEIDGTPFRLDATDIQAPIDNAPTFKMPEVPYRERVAQGLHDTIAQRYREKRKHTMETAEKAHRTPRFGSSRSTGGDGLSLLSPAARQLATNKLGIRRLTGNLSSKPTTPLFSPSTSVRTPGSLKRPGSQSPSVSSMIRRPSATPKLASITDDLMQVSTEAAREEEKKKAGGRATAGDFF